MAFTDRMKEARLKSGLTQEGIAKIIGVAKSTYTGYEKGNSEPNMLILSRIMDALSIDANYLFQDEVKTRYENKATPEEMENLVKKFRKLDELGREAVTAVLNVEYRRATETQSLQPADDTDENITYFPVPLQSLPASAGTGMWALESDTQDIMLTKRPPHGTDCLVKVRGNSMEPTYYDGEMVFIRQQNDIRIGQIGIFYMDGQMWIKELGDGELISHNGERYPPRKMMEDIQCQGLVLGVCDESYFEK